MKLYLTGHGGFVGQALLKSIAEGKSDWNGVELVGTKGIDILDFDALTRDIAISDPDAVIHLAALSNVPDAIANPISTAQVNVLGTINVVEAVARQDGRCRLIHVGSSDVYGLIAPDELPISEDKSLSPRNPYAASKAAAEMFVLERVRRTGMPAVCTRPFNHTGLGQTRSFVFPSIANQLASIALGLQSEIVLGDIDITRDFLDVDDVLAAYRTLIRRGADGEVYNICSGREFKIRDGIDIMAAALGIRPEIRSDASLMRHSEQRRVCGDNSKIRRLGWEPLIPIEDTLRRLALYTLKQKSKNEEHAR